MPAPATQIWRFGVFEVDAHREEIRRAGIAIKLREQSFRILILLLENANELVTREDLRKALWPEDTYVDFDHSLNSALMRLREALGDSAENSLYIQTIPRRGYRFIAPVEVLSSEQPIHQQATVSHPPVASPPAETPPRTPSFATPSASPLGAARVGKSGFWRWVMPGALVAAALAAGYWYLHSALPTPRVSIYAQLTYDNRQKGFLAGTDGSRLYFNLSEPQWIADVPISGGQITRIPVEVQDGIVRDVSPDGSSLLVVTGMYDTKPEIWVIGSMGRPARRLVRGRDAAWSPDGNSIVYAWHGNVYSVSKDGNNPRLLVDSAVRTENAQTLVKDPSWSPDGSRIRFFRGNAIWEVSSDGSNLHEMLQGWHSDSRKCCGRWTPDGKMFVFATVDESVPTLPGGQLWAIDEQREWLRSTPAQPIQLSSGPIRWDTPIPSRDGQRLFARGITLRGELVRYDKQTRNLQPYLGGISAEYLDFSPDGKSVAYVTFPEGILWRSNLDGTGLMQLTEPPLYPRGPRWSPDSTRILFSALRPNHMDALYLLSSQGGVPKLVLPEEREANSDGSWSSDGKKIVYTSAKLTGWGVTFESDIRVLDLATHAVTLLPGSDGMYSPRPSPDGRYIAGLNVSTSEHYLRIFDMQTQRWTTLQEGTNNFPSWSKDGQSIYFLGSPNNHTIFRTSIKGGHAERVVDLTNVRETGYVQCWLGLDPNDAPLLLRDIGVDEIYALTLER